MSDAADSMEVDAQQGAFGSEAEVPPRPDPQPAARPEGADGRCGMGGDAERKMHQAEEERGSRARDASGGRWAFALPTDFEGKGGSFTGWRSRIA